jgi:hypothetical protein
MYDESLSRGISAAVIEALNGRDPNVPVRIRLSSTQPGYAMALTLTNGDTSWPHCKYLAHAVHEQAAMAQGGLHVFVADERRRRFHIFSSYRLNPCCGRILICAVGDEDKPKAALEAVAAAESLWNERREVFEGNEGEQQQTPAAHDNAVQPINAELTKQE